MLLWQINIIVVVAGITYTVIMTTECELVISLGELEAQNWPLILYSLPTSRGDAQRNNGARPHTVIRALAPPWSLYSHDDPSVFCVWSSALQTAAASGFLLPQIPVVSIILLLSTLKGERDNTVFYFWFT